MTGSSPPRLLIVANTPSPNTLRLAEAAEAGAIEAGDVAVSRLPPLSAGVSDVLSADAVIIGTTENFGAMSGQIKDFFERIYYPCLEKTQAKPWALYVRAGRDGTGATKGVESIVTGLRWRAISRPLLLHGEHSEAFCGQCKELGAAAAAGLTAGIF